MATVTGKLIGGIPQSAEVRASLVDVTGARAVGYVADETAEIVRPVGIIPQTDGTWSAELIPNALIESTVGDTVWAVQEGRALDGTPVMTYILVPEAGGPHWVGDLRVDLGDAPTGGSTIVYVPGPAGGDGTDGVDGMSAYEVWLEAGNAGTEADYLASLVGPPGTAEAQEYTDTVVAAEAERADTAYEPAGAAATAQAAAVTAAAADATTKASNAQTAATTAAAALYLPKALLTVDAFMAQPGTKVFGHRGAGMVCPEHTEAAYDYAVSHGIQAMELSVNVDSEGQLWCIHDLTLDRTTYSTGAVNTYPTTGLANRVLTNGRAMLGQGWTDQPMVPLRKMLDKYLGRGVVLFLEPKGNDAVVPLQTLLATSYPHANQSVIWKAHIGTSFVWPKNNGFRTWCYLDDASTDATINGKDSLVDYWGVSTSMPSARRKEIVTRGKPVFSWPVYRRSQRTALEADGIVGLMSSDPVYVRGTTAQATASRWDLQVKESGGTPMADYTTDGALKFEDAPNLGWVSINKPKGTYGLGRYCPIVPGAGGYRISFDMKYDAFSTDLALHGGLYLGKAADDVYEFSVLNATAGYHWLIRQNGFMRFSRHVVGQTGGITIGADVQTDPPVAGQSMSFQIDITPTTVESRRLGNPLWTTGVVADTTNRGGYFGLSNGSITDVAVRPFWRNLLVTPL